MTEVERRSRASLLVRDRDGAVLLICGGDPSRPEAGTWWFTPGGGVEDGETDEQAALRELAEETGLADVPLRRIAYERDVEFSFGGHLVQQHETWFLVETDRFEPDAGGWTEVEVRAQTAMRWWTADELRATSQTVHPAELADLLTSA